MIEELSDIYGNPYVRLIGENGEQITLSFKGESYGDIDNIIEIQTNLNESVNKNVGNMEKAFEELNTNTEMTQRKAVVADMKSYVADIADMVGDKTYVVE
jgi:hypothetical protein